MTALTLDGKRVFVATSGVETGGAQGALLLIHGAGMDHRVWEGTLAALAGRGRRCFAVDLPGHGGSEGPALEDIPAMADWLLRLIDLLDLGHFRLAGHSMGSLIALEAAGRVPDRVAALALLGFVPEMRVADKLLTEARSAPAAAAARILRASFADPKPDRIGGAEALMSASESLGTDLVACNAYDGASAAAARLRCPALLLLGGKDRLTPSAQGQLFAGRLPDVRVAILPEAGHLMMIEDPEVTVAALLTVL